MIVAKWGSDNQLLIIGTVPPLFVWNCSVFQKKNGMDSYEYK